MRAEADWAIEERAMQLTVLHLTRREELTVTRAARDANVDFLVNVSKEGKLTGRVFAVEVKGRISLRGVGVLEAGSGEIRLSTHWASVIERASVGRGELPFPLCLFFFTMVDDHGYYAWLRRPVNDASAGEPVLRTERPTTLKPLTNDALDELVDSVTEWYDQRTVSPKPAKVRALPAKSSKSPARTRARRRVKTA
jgi:hypothetical protein